MSLERETDRSKASFFSSLHQQQKQSLERETYVSQPKKRETEKQRERFLVVLFSLFPKKIRLLGLRVERLELRGKGRERSKEKAKKKE